MPDKNVGHFFIVFLGSEDFPWFPEDLPLPKEEFYSDHGTLIIGPGDLSGAGITVLLDGIDLTA